MGKNVVNHIMGLRQAMAVVTVLATMPGLAAPVIQVDSADFDYGRVMKGSTRSISHVFKVRNSGDEPLRIRRVRPG